ncbi:MAG: glutamine-hydrolyzing carbamoyl-phosphate synthase small subunit [Planctomycetes bacterium]|nr:glutamine-hydrolyzing carbamoyl-phosphate synthase small subunit [Planctomycetota bacterium]
MSKPPVARLALEDGTVFRGEAFGHCDASRIVAGEVVFNTALTGYQEALTDPSYAGQILVFTAPLIGNYGVSPEDAESAGPRIVAVVIRELSRVHANHRAITDLSRWLAEAGVPAIQSVDTRALVRRLRSDGSMRGVLSVGTEPADRDLVARALSSPSMVGRNLAAEVSPEAVARWNGRQSSGGPHVVVLDCGAKQSIMGHLARRGCEVTVAPHDLSAEQVRALEPDGVLVSNGPGDPDAVLETIRTLGELAGDVPIFGICLGHQLLALALGAKAYKLKFGHRGANQPVRNVLTGRVEITSQNHGFCIDMDSLAGIDCEVTHVNLNDGTLAGFRHRSLPIFSVQYHPESSPGPHDSVYLFDCFLHLMETRRPIDAAAMRAARKTADAGMIAHVARNPT